MAEYIVIILPVLVTVVGVIIGIALFSVWVDQCHLGNGPSLNIQVDRVKLLTHPTDNVFLGWESLFGKPSDEISVYIQSRMCGKSNLPQKIKEQETIEFGKSLSINSFYGNGFQFWLVEADSHFEGADDRSNVISISSQKMDKMRDMFDNGAADFIDLDYTVTVKGANIFQENRWFGFLAENLCVNALDFVMGPWTSKVVGKAVLFKSGDMAKLYYKLKGKYKAGSLTRKQIYKSVIGYQFRAGAKAAVKKPLQRKGTEYITQWALDQTQLDETIEETVTALKEDGVYTVGGQKGLDLYREVNKEIATWAGYLETFTDSLEFCLSDILPMSKDAAYHVELTVRR